MEIVVLLLDYLFIFSQESWSFHCSRAERLWELRTEGSPRQTLRRTCKLFTEKTQLDHIQVLAVIINHNIEGDKRSIQTCAPHSSRFTGSTPKMQLKHWNSTAADNLLNSYSIFWLRSSFTEMRARSKQEMNENFCARWNIFRVNVRAPSFMSQRVSQRGILTWNIFLLCYN